jgi:hypothetical protein
MASVRVTLGISSADVLTTALGLNVATTLTADSGTMIRAKVADTSGAVAETSLGAADGTLNGITVYKANDKDTSAYVYVNNLATEFEDYIYLYNATDSDLTYDALVESSVAKIAGGEFAFIPVAVDKTFRAYGTKVNQIIEYGVFGQDNPANTLG